MPDAAVFKTCPGCLTTWMTSIELVQDITLEFNGYQASFDRAENGLFFFTHHLTYCHSTLAISVRCFKDYYNGPEYKIHNTGSPTCSGRCLLTKNYETCHEICDMRWIREVLQYLRRHEIPPHLLVETTGK
jgi:hypothetical protein